MSRFVLKKEALLDWLRKKIDENDVYAPAVEAGQYLFRPVERVEDIDLSRTNTKNAPKAAFFPHTEVMLTFRTAEGGPVITSEGREGRPMILFGLRPCDARSFVILDRLFLGGEYVDPYYAKRRSSALVIANACNNPAPTCFCTRVGGSPFGTEGADVLLVDIGEGRYLADPVTEKGESFIRGVDGISEAGDAEVAKRADLERAAVEAIEGGDLLSGLKERLDVMFQHPFWDTLYLPCIACGNCTYNCPTCHCFDIVDEADNRGGLRLRAWDSCMYPLFTLHASGHNPRPTGKERWRQRLLHKFRYYVDNFGVAACVGCGRCIINCPVSMDIRKILANILSLDIEAGSGGASQ